MKKSKNQKILFLEDNPIHSEVIFDSLSDAGYEVKKVHNLAEAEKVIDREEFIPDLFLLDIVINSIKTAGIQFCRKVREDKRFSEAPLLFISAHLDDLHKEKYAEVIKGENVLPKPFDFEQLLEKIREVLKH